jgi:MYXO-CTERM domain-containing protein
MRTFRSLAAVAVTLLACAAVSGAAPVEFNGEADSPDFVYPGPIEVHDPVEGVFESPSWDIQGVEFIESRPGMYVHVDTLGPFDRNGGDTSITGTTLFVALLTEASGRETQMIELTLTETTGELRIDGAPVEEGPHHWEQWSAGVSEDGHLWIWIGSYFLAPFVYSPWAGPWVHPWPRGFELRARLDDCDAGADDVIVGWVPQPAGLALLALGAAALLRRRGRPRAL